jgi:TRAP-type uncharacterized transport system fused permease subunit
MFIFYYAVLSEVSPPTALSPFAAAAITGGNPFRTTMLTWKYVIPAFIVPFVFTLSEEGMGLLLQGSAISVIRASLAGIAGVVAISVAISGWLYGRASGLERGALVGAAVLLFATHPLARIVGAAAAALTLISHRRRVSLRPKA